MNQRDINRRDRLDAARAYLATADILTARGDFAAASEMIWGAFANALDALAQKRYRRDRGSNAARRDFIADMRDMRVIDAEEADGVFDGALALHAHFYKPWLPYKDRAADARLTRLFIDRLMALASDGGAD